jgi:hypothetical protein
MGCQGERRGSANGLEVGSRNAEVGKDGSGNVLKWEVGKIKMRKNIESPEADKCRRNVSCLFYTKD